MLALWWTKVSKFFSSIKILLQIKFQLYSNWRKSYSVTENSDKEMTVIRWMAYYLIFSFLMSGSWFIFGRTWGKLYSSLQVYLGISLNQWFPPHPIITNSCHFNPLKFSVICLVANTLVQAILGSLQNFN